uniref:Uncharacterized protein n=1 Tax=Anguilla anguilla TaxID=7936 RepID=A0A0E9Q1J2_ANGAN
MWLCNSPPGSCVRGHVGAVYYMATGQLLFIFC